MHAVNKTYDQVAVRGPMLVPAPAQQRPPLDPFGAVTYTAKPLISKRLQAVCDLIVLGKSNKEIAYLLHLTTGTVKVYANQLFAAVGVGGRYELMALYFQHQLQTEIAVERSRQHAIQLPGA